MAEAVRPDDVQRAQGGDARAFERLYRGNVDRIYAICLRMSGDPRHAEELTQASFIQAWRSLAQFRGESAFSTWLHRLAVNQCLQDRRGARRSVVRLASDPAIDPKARTPVPPGTRADLERAIAALPDGARQVLVLHDVEGWPHDEIAAALGVSVGTTKSQLSRARLLLREVLR